jgi:hypothetical protein
MATTNKQEPETPTTVEEALDQYWKCKGMAYNVPDYVGFKVWLAEKIEAARATQAVALPIHVQTEIPPYSLLVLELIKAAENAGIEIAGVGQVLQQDRFGKYDGKGSRLKCFNRGKLLLSFLRDLPERVRDFYFTTADLLKKGAMHR